MWVVRLHGGGHEGGEAQDVDALALDGLGDLGGRYVLPEVVDDVSSGGQHGLDDVLSDVVDISLDDGGGCLLCVGEVLLGDGGKQEIESGVHRMGGYEDLGQVDLVGGVLVADHVHSLDQSLVDGVDGVDSLGQDFLGCGFGEVRLAVDDRVGELLKDLLFGHYFTPLPAFAGLRMLFPSELFKR